MVVVGSTLEVWPVAGLPLAPSTLPRNRQSRRDGARRPSDLEDRRGRGRDARRGRRRARLAGIVAKRLVNRCRRAGRVKAGRMCFPVRRCYDYGVPPTTTKKKAASASSGDKDFISRLADAGEERSRSSPSFRADSARRTRSTTFVPEWTILRRRYAGSTSSRRGSRSSSGSSPA